MILDLPRLFKLSVAVFKVDLEEKNGKKPSFDSQKVQL